MAKKSSQKNKILGYYSIYIALPLDYEESAEKYPALYITDANESFPRVTQDTRLLQLGNELPKILVIGIGYPVPTFRDTLDLRARDLTPTSVESKPGSGGADKFLSFIRNQVIPFAESRYRVDPENRSLFGHSYGGLFVLYAMLKESQVFQRYIAGSPSIEWDHQVLLKIEKQYAEENEDLLARLFMGLGDLESADLHANVWHFISVLKSREYKSLELQAYVFPDETHLSVVGALICRGLRFSYPVQKPNGKK